MDRLNEKIELARNIFAELTEQDVMELIVVLGDKDDRIAAACRITDQVALGRIAKTDRTDIVRWYAVHRITDHDLLAEIAKSELSDYVRNAAVRLLTDPTVLAHIAKSDKSDLVRGNAVTRLYWLGEKNK